ncbi:MAG: hypothetical protein KKA84_15680 [Bacteroidetes bacterium]|nr:hypothetical protein [Bacteroidota bacterium]
MALVKSIRIKKILRQLKLNPSVLKNLQSDIEWAEKAFRGDNQFACVVTVSLHDYTSGACERLSPEEFIENIAGLQKQVSMLVENTPAIFTSNHLPEIQAVFSSNFSGEEFLDKALQFAIAISGILNDVNDELTFPMTSPKVGIACGQAIAGIIQTSDSAFYSFTGRPIYLSRMLAFENHRFNELILIDNETGNRINMARPLDLYRIPGYNEINTLYSIPDSERENEETRSLFKAGLQLLYLEKNNKHAATIFRKITSMNENYFAAKEMLVKCEAPCGEIKLRSYRVL